MTIKIIKLLGQAERVHLPFSFLFGLICRQVTKRRNLTDIQVFPQQHHHTQHNLARHPLLLGRMSLRQQGIYGR